jgi:hypothetical protein
VNQIYQEIKGDIWNFVNLWKSVKAAGMNVPYILTLLKVANNPLPAVENSKEISLLEFDKRNSARDFQNLNDQIISMAKTLDSIHLDREKEMARLQHLQQERMNQDALVNHFKNNNEAYVKLTKTEEKVISILVDRKELLGRAVLCVIESIRKDPDKFGPLICYNDDKTAPPATVSVSPTAEYYNRSYYYPPSYTYPGGEQQQQQATKDSFKQPYIDMLKEQSEKFFTSLEKMLADEAINQYVSKTTVASPSSLHMLLLDEKQQQKSSSP